MKGLKYFIIITKREFSEQYHGFFRAQGINTVFSKLCNGTAQDNVLDCLGLERTQNIMLEGMVPCDVLSTFKEKLVSDMDIESTGNGIALFLNVDAIGGQSSKTLLIGDIDISTNKENDMAEKEVQTVLILTVVVKGYSHLVMDGAREAGATGGTVVKANGTGAEIAKFFGVSISQEKELVYIVAKKSQRDDIMHSIISKAGANTDAHGIVFSLPVDSVLGIKAFE